MLTKRKTFLLTLLALVQALIAFSQADPLYRPIKKDTIPGVTKDSLTVVPDTATLPQRNQIAIFTPLYLDSAFDIAGNYRYKTSFPKFINPGLEFWEGAQLAIDSLEQEGIEVDIHVYDTRSVKNRFQSVIMSDEIKKMNLIIGHVTLNETVMLARVAASQGIPFINVNLPNDAGVKNNPNFVVLNSTLTTHCAGIYKFLQKNFALSNIIVFRKKGTQEDRLKEYFMEVEKTTMSVPLKLKYVTLPANFTPEQLTLYLDSNITNVCMSGSLDVNFAQRLCQQLGTLGSSYATTIMGMPTWDVIDFEKPQFKNIEVYYSTPFYMDMKNELVADIHEKFKNVFYSRPSDMVFRGFETLYHFAHLLNLHNSNISSSLGDKKFKVFNEFDIQPVLDKQTFTLDYFENKRLYFVRKVDGEVKAVY